MLHFFVTKTTLKKTDWILFSYILLLLSSCICIVSLDGCFLLSLFSVKKILSSPSKIESPWLHIWTMKQWWRMKKLCRFVFHSNFATTCFALSQLSKVWNCVHRLITIGDCFGPWLVSFVPTFLNFSIYQLPIIDSFFFFQYS